MPKEDSLTAYIRGLWEKAKEAKSSVEQTIIECLRRRKSEYSPDKLSLLKSTFGQDYDPPFIPLTLIKCVSAESWIKEILFGSSETPYDIEPTPEPDIYKEDLQSIITEVYNKEFQKFQMTHPQPDNIDIETFKAKVTRKIQTKVKAEIRKRAKEIARELKFKIDDQLVESGWYDALKEVIYDIVTFPAGILSGVYFVKNKKLVISQGQVSVEDTVVPLFRRVNPLDIFPDPDATGIDDGYLFERIKYTKADLYNFKGLEGVNEENLDLVLEKFRDSGIREATPIDQERDAIEGRVSSGTGTTTKIDCLIFWGKIDGKYLEEWNLPSPDDLPFEENRPYDVCVWLVENMIIRILLNPDPLGKKPYHKVSFFEVSDSFWGQGIPQVLYHIQNSCNSLARNILLNAAFASSPLTEVNIDRLAEGETPTLHPYKVFEVTSQQLQEAPAIRFTTPQLIADRLIMIYRQFSAIADEVTVPAYAHGVPNVGGGAGRTASGFAMLREGATMNIKNVISAIDAQIIQSSISQLYYYDVMYGLVEDIPDARIVAKGSNILAFKEQKAREYLEILNFTNNPNDLPFINREKLIEAVLRAKGIDITEALKEGVEDDDIMTQQMLQDPKIAMAMNNPQAFNAATGGTPPSEAPVDAAGNPVVGQDVRMFGTGENS